jgi:hypothetical protein
MVSNQTNNTDIEVPDYEDVTYTITEDGAVLTETVEGYTMPADYSFATVNDFVHRHDIVFDELVYLCLGMAEYIDSLKVPPQKIEVQHDRNTNI